MVRPLMFRILLLLVLLTGCSRKESSPLATGAVVQNPAADASLPGFVDDGPYAVVRAEALPDYYGSFRKRLFDDGVVKWDERFDCNHFASYYIALAQTQYYLKNFHSSTPAQTLAMAEVWYRPTAARGKGHAIVAIWTDQGLVFVEPQTGGRLQLSSIERQSAYLVKW